MAKNNTENTAEKSYSATIKLSSRELSAKERIMMKDTTACGQLDELVQLGGDRLEITPDSYAVISVHNEKSKDKKDYEKLVIIDKYGDRYVTGSESFTRTFLDLCEEMGNEEFSILVFKKESKNYSGKGFLTCTIA